MREDLAADLGEFGIECQVREVDLDAHDLVHVGVGRSELRTPVELGRSGLHPASDNLDTSESRIRLFLMGG
jgi:hypothetical protein